MKYVADLHIHSHYSLATSKDLAPEALSEWAMIKGIKIIGTGDFTHPKWLKELKEKLEPAEPGLFRLKKEYCVKKSGINFPLSKQDDVRFILSAEISNIYKKAGKTRKIHNVILAPDFSSAAAIQQKLDSSGFNISSDGRPILGLDSRHLLEMVLTISPECFFIPAHIWTPWFSALGANSGFNSIKECYQDMAEHIFAVETGLSSDPPMNWLCSFLDGYTLVSNSDAHSPEKLGRNANIFDTEISYGSLTDALKTGNPKHCLGTIDMYPQEGKYHYAGHSKCGVCWSPEETIMNKSVCSVCGRQVTNGVMNRVAELSDRQKPTDRRNRLPFHYTIPLKEIIAELLDTGVASKQVAKTYARLISHHGSEIDILLNSPIEELMKSEILPEILGEAIARMRSGNVHISHGYDGQYGIIRVFDKSEIKSFGKNKIAFANMNEPKRPKKKYDTVDEFCLPNINEPEYISDMSIKDTETEPIINTEQQAAIAHFSGPALVISGPGTGKTFILAKRTAALIDKGINPENILALTFTNKAAKEMKERVDKLIGNSSISDKLTVSTFHAFGLSVLRRHFQLVRRKKNFVVINEAEKLAILRKIITDDKQPAEIASVISEIKQNRSDVNPSLTDVIKKYEAKLTEMNCLDFDDLIFYPLRLFDASPQLLSEYSNTYKWILIDEYQDINLIQYQLVKKLMNTTDANLFAIGDANQAIYGFRGADVTFIRQFVIDNPTATVYRLKQSYRCSDNILCTSHQMISGISGFTPDATNLTHQTSLKGITEGRKVTIVKNSSDKSEAEFIARTIENMLGGLRFFSMDSGISDGYQNDGTYSPGDFAILCRLGRQFETIEKALNDHGIPFQTIGETPFFRQEPIASIIEFLELAYMPDNIFLKGKLISKKIICENDLSTLQIADKPTVGATLRKKLEYIVSHYFRNAKSQHEKLINRMLDLAEQFGGNARDFADFAALGTSSDSYLSAAENVSLMTIHASKGLEFKCVFIAGCEDGIIPLNLSHLTNVKDFSMDIEEEKRLLYVGMTRAKLRLFISHAGRRYIFGKTFSLEKCRFISNIQQQLLENITTDKPRKKEKDTSQLDLF